jgi:antitoxin YobK
MTLPIIRLHGAIKESGGKIANLGTSDEAVSEQEVSRVETILGFAIPVIYKLFLQTYGSGEVFGDELFSIYGESAQDIPSGDLVYQYRWYTSRTVIDRWCLPFLATGHGEVFYFKCSSTEPEQVHVITGENHELYAHDFIDFLGRYTKL